MEELIAKRYAKALSMATTDVSSLVAQLDVISEALSNKEVSTALLSPIVDSDKKTDMVLAILDDSDGVLKNFIKVLGGIRSSLFFSPRTLMRKRDLTLSQRLQKF